MALKSRYDGNGAFIGSDLVSEPIRANGSPEGLAVVAEKIRSTMRPASQEKIEQWIAELSVITPPRKSDGMTLELLLAAYTKRLAGFPADMVREVLIVRTWQFFPTWFELDAVLNAMLSARRAMLSACEVSIPRPPPEPERDILSPERRAALAAELGLPVIGAKAMGMDENN